MPPLPRVPKTFIWFDGLTKLPVPRDDAWYITKDFGKDKSIPAVYTMDTINALIKTKQPSPLQKKPFTWKDVKRVPLPGSLHPALEGGPLSDVFSTYVDDTVTHLLDPADKGDFVHFMTTGTRKQSVSVGKRDTESKAWRLRLSLDLDMASKPKLKGALEALSTILQESSTRVRVSKTLTRREPALEPDDSTKSTTKKKNAPKKSTPNQNTYTAPSIESPSTSRRTSTLPPPTIPSKMDLTERLRRMALKAQWDASIPNDPPTTKTTKTKTKGRKRRY
jgi:hypothetical protein